MKGEINDLKIFIIAKTLCVYYVYYFSYQLQLRLVTIAKRIASVLVYLIHLYPCYMLLEYHLGFH